MGKPRMIILIRHAQSEGNLNRDVHQIIPDHRVQLTPEGRKQALDAGRRLRAMLKPDDTIRLYTSPYRRTRETTEGLLASLTESSEETGPSPFSRESIIVREEPRLREQDFGNFQPCSAEMERMWQERADYGHFFYRIPNGESAADAYDRISGFNDSIWRSFEEDDFPSVLILVTHGLMTRVFLMRWFHYSVETFEDLRNINHCEFVIMNRSPDTNKFVLENRLRTWSEMKRRATISGKDRRQSSVTQAVTAQAQVPVRQWGGCVDGCNHRGSDRATRRRRAEGDNGTSTDNNESRKPSTIGEEKSAPETTTSPVEEGKQHQLPPISIPAANVPQTQPSATQSTGKNKPLPLRPDRLDLLPSSPFALRSPFTAHLRGRDAGGSLSGMPTPDTDHFPTSDTESISPVSEAPPPPNVPRPAVSSKQPGEYFPSTSGDKPHTQSRRHRDRASRSSPRSISALGVEDADFAPDPPNTRGREVDVEGLAAGEEEEEDVTGRRRPRRTTTREDLEKWMAQSGMGRGTRADALGDAEESESESEEDGDGEVEMKVQHGGEPEAQAPSLAEVEREEKEDKSLEGSVY